VARVAAPVAPISNIESDAKLGFVEFLLTSVDVQESARRAIDWLVAHVSITEAAVLVVDGQGGEMLLVAEHGISSGAIIDFALARDDSRHPLVEALSGAETNYIKNLASHHPSPLESRTFYAVPLRADVNESSYGLLLVASPGPALDADAVWLGRMLGKHVSRLL